MSLYIFDKDGTLVKNVAFSGFRKPLRPEDQILRPGVYEKLAQIRAAGHTIALASNMSAVGLGLISMAEAEALMQNCADKVGGVTAWKCCGASPKGKKIVDGLPNPYARDDTCRKPHPGMILDLMVELGFPPEDTYMVGNKRDDQQAALASGVHYIKARDFFERVK